MQVEVSGASVAADSAGVAPVPVPVGGDRDDPVSEIRELIGQGTVVVVPLRRPPPPPNPPAPS